MNTESYVEIESMRIYELSALADAILDTSNQAIYAESKESIGFSVGMNCSAQIYTEQDAVKFLYSYNNKSLADIMDLYPRRSAFANSARPEN